MYICIYISHHTHTHAQNKSRSEIAFVVLQLHCQLKVVPEGPSLILSKSGIEHRPFCERTLTWVPGVVGSHAKESAAMHRLPYRGVSALTPYVGHPSAHDSRGPGRRTLPRAAQLFFFPRPRITWVSRRPARQVVKPNVEELRARPAHKDRRSGAGARDAGRPDPQLWCARTHTQAPAHWQRCLRSAHTQLRICPTLRLPPRPVLPFNTVSDS